MCLLCLLSEGGHFFSNYLRFLNYLDYLKLEVDCDLYYPDLIFAYTDGDEDSVPEVHLEEE